MTHARLIARQTAILTIGQFAGLGISLFATVIVTRALGPEGRAVYSWLLTLVGFAIQLALLAPPAAVRAFAATDRAALPGTLAALCCLGALGTLPLAALVLLDPTIGSVSRPYLELAWLAVPITATTQSLNTLVHIRARPLSVLAVQAGPRVLQLGLALALYGLGLLDLPAAILLFVVTAACELALSLAFGMTQLADLRPSLRLMRNFLRLMGIGWVAALAIFAVPRIGLIILGSHAPLEATGRYSVALTLQEALLVAPVALGGVLITQVGRHGLSGSAGRRGTILVLAGAAGATSLAALLAPAFIRLTFGEAFAPAAASFRALAVGIVLVTIYQLCQPLLYARGGAAAIATPALGAFSVALLAALALIPTLGATGAILSNLLGFATLAALGLLVASRLQPAPAVAA